MGIVLVLLAVTCAGQPMDLNFDGVDVGEVSKVVGAITGQTFVLDPDVTGSVRFLSFEPIDSNSLEEIFEGILDGLGFAVVQIDGDIFRIMSAESASRFNETVLLELKHTSPEVMCSLLQEILRGGEGVNKRTLQKKTGVISLDRVMIAVSEGRLAVSGNKRDIKRILGVVKVLDVPRDRQKDGVEVIYLRHADSKTVSSSVQALVGSIPALRGQQTAVVANEETNSIVVIAPSQSIEIIQELIKKLDIETISVVVEMVIMEVTEEALREIGVDWATMDSPGGGVRGFSSTNLGPMSSYSGGTLEGLALGAWKGSTSAANIGLLLRALEKNSGVEILSCPNVICSNHLLSKIVVGENRPFVNEARITESTTPINPTVVKGFAYQDVGITLQVTPHVSPDSTEVRLEIDTQFTKLVESGSTTLETPVTTKREIVTVVTMESGNTVVIGGLIGEDKAKVVKGVPFLKDLPLVGAIFRNVRETSTKTNLILFITPRIRKVDKLSEVTEVQKELAEPNEPLRSSARIPESEEFFESKVKAEGVSGKSERPVLEKSPLKRAFFIQAL